MALTFGPTVPGRDTEIYEAAATNNMGARNTNRISYTFANAHFNSLYAWDVSSIAIGARVLSATLTYTTQYTTLTSPQACAIYPLTRLFTEGSENFGAAGTGATWNKYDSTGEGGHNWNTAGGDYDAAYSAAFNAPIAAGGVGDVVVDVTSVVQKALDSYRSGGFIGLLGRVTGAALGANKEWQAWSREAGTSANRPTLTIQYVVGGVMSDECGRRASDWLRIYQGTSGETDGGGSTITNLYAALDAGTLISTELDPRKLVCGKGRILEIPSGHTRLALMGLSSSGAAATITAQIWGIDQAPAHVPASSGNAAVGNDRSKINLGFCWELVSAVTFTAVNKPIKLRFDNAGQVIPDRTSAGTTYYPTNTSLIDLGSANAAGVFVPPRFVLATVSAISDQLAAILAKTW